MTDFHFQPKGYKSDFGWHSRGYLPHFDCDEVTQFMTISLSDSMPQELLNMWRRDCSTKTAFRKKVEQYLDAGHGKCWLADERVAAKVEESLRYYDGTKYRLFAWVVMPNHAHFLITLLPNVHLPEVLHSLKSFTAHEANKLLDRTGQFWQHESFDRYIRDVRHFNSVVRYNPVKAGLCTDEGKWQFGSARLRNAASNN